MTFCEFIIFYYYTLHIRDIYIIYKIRYITSSSMHSEIENKLNEEVENKYEIKNKKKILI